LLQLLENAANHPLDIAYVVQLTRAAQDIESVFQLHQVVMNTMARVMADYMACFKMRCNGMTLNVLKRCINSLLAYSRYLNAWIACLLM